MTKPNPDKFLVLDNIPIAIFILDSDFNVMYWNNVIEEWTKIKKEDILNTNIGLHFPHLIEKKYHSRIKTIFEYNTPIIFSAQLHKHFIPVPLSANKLRIQHTTVTPITIAGQDSYALFAIHDVTELTNRIYDYQSLHNKALAEIEERKQVEKALSESEGLFKSLAQVAPVGIFRMDADGNCIYVNDRWCQITGLSLEEARNEGWLQSLHPDDASRTLCQWHNAVGEGQYFESEWRILRPHGVVTWIMGQAIAERRDDGQLIGFIGTIIDITERKEAEESVNQANASLTVTVAELEQRGRESAMLNQFSELLQTCQTMEEGYDALVLWAPKLFPSETGALASIDPSGTMLEIVSQWGDSSTQSEPVFTPDDCWALRRGQFYEVNREHPNLPCKHLGKVIPQTYICIPLIVHGKILGLLHIRQTDSVQPDWTPAKRHFMVAVAETIKLALANLNMRATLREQAIRDPLTGLFNRRYMEASLDREIHRAQRKSHTIGLIIIDIDHFKGVNDSFGHDAGDAVLRQLGKFLQAHIRKDDIACRLGGEEFVLIMPEASLEITSQRAELLREKMPLEQIQCSSQVLPPISISLGTSAFPQHGLNGGAILNAADAALYQAKTQGRNRVVQAQ